MPDDDRAAIWEGMVDGTIDICSSDHAPHTREEKEIGWTEMWSCHTGTPGIQYYYPLLLDAVNRASSTLDRVRRLVGDATGGKRSALAATKGSHRRSAPTPTSLSPIMDSTWTITQRRRAVPVRMDAV